MPIAAVASISSADRTAYCAAAPSFLKVVDTLMIFAASPPPLSETERKCETTFITLFVGAAVTLDPTTAAAFSSALHSASSDPVKKSPRLASILPPVK